MKVSDLKNYKDSLYAAFSRDIAEFEKNFLLVAGGILAFSITFIDKIIQIKNSHYLCLLFSGWFFIILAIALMMIAFLKSAKASDDLWKEADDFLIKNSLHKEDTELSDPQITTIKNSINKLFYENKKFLRRIRYAAIVSFIVGLILFALFVALNLLVEKNKVTEKNKSNISIKIDNLEYFLTDTIINSKHETIDAGRTDSTAKTKPNNPTKTIPTANKSTQTIN